MDTSPILSIFLPPIFTVFLAAFTLYIVRIVKGPTVFDMALAVDCLAFDLAVFIALLSLYYDTPFLIAGAIALALWAYILDIYISKYFLTKELGGHK